MKTYILYILSYIMAATIQAQNCEIALRPLVTQSADGNYFPQVVSYLTNRIRILTEVSNSSGALESSQFALAASYDIIDKHIVAGTPTKIIYNITLSMHIVDLQGEKVFSSYSKEIKGIGDNETKALINTFQKISINNTDIKAFVQAGKQRVLEYYNANYQNIIKKAQTLATLKNFDAAIFNLMMVPECCIGYDIIMNELMVVYKKFVDQHCNENLAQAKAAWIASPNSEGAATASIYLSEIYPDATCYKDAQELASEIKKQMGKEHEFRMRQWADGITLERQRIDAMREISIAYANSQPKAEITNVFWK